MIFQKSIVNTGRQAEIDLSRGFDALIIILCHVGLYLGNAAGKAVYTFSDIIGSEPGAPVFMALMGASIAFSRRQSPELMFLRGVQLFICGYLLSAYRTLLPRLIFGNIDEWTTIESFFVVDIFQFAGLAFMLIALLRLIKIPSWGILGVSLVMVWIGQFFIANPPEIQNEWLTYFLNLFIPLTEWSCFPLLTWFFFPAFGFAFGELLLHCSNKKLLYGILLPVSLAGVIHVYWQFHCYYPDYAEKYYYGGNFYYMGVKNVLMNAMFITFILSFWYFANSFMPSIIKRYLTFLSRNLTVFYIFTWVYISIFIHLSAKLSLTFGTVATLLMMVVMLALCSASVYLFVVVRRKIRLAHGKDIQLL